MSTAYDWQQQLQEMILEGRSIILQAPTGAGKTRAALMPFLHTFWDAPADTFSRKCLYAVPMRVLANQFYEETFRNADKYRRLYHREINAGRQTGEYREDPEFRADITFATIDQVLGSWLMAPWGLSMRMANMNAGALVGSYLVFDEFHLFDPDSTLPAALQMLRDLKGVSPFLLMTATFSADMLQKLADHLDAVPFLLTEAQIAEIPAQHKERRFFTAAAPLTEKDEDGRTYAAPWAIDHILAAHQEQTLARPRTLVVCNQVERAQAVFAALSGRKPEGVTVRLLHSRFLKQDRADIEAFVRREFGKEKENQTVPSLILVATQVVEVGLDMSCAVLHTELAPASSVLQRAGRCARYAGEQGDVFVYPLDEKGYQPYAGNHARQQADLTLEWLQANQGRHLTFADEQALINHAHTESDNQILQGVFGSAFERREQLIQAQSGEKNRGEVATLIRNIASVSVAVHNDPDQLRADPFRAEMFSLHPGTLKGKFGQWKAANDSRDPGFDDDHLEWLVCRLIEDEDDEAAQGNRPIRYQFKPVTSIRELNAPLLVINPALVGYSRDLGLTLWPGETYRSAVRESADSRSTSRQAYSYRLESWQRHTELVHHAFVRDELPRFQAAAARLERAYGWQPGLITDMAHLVIALHDLGKLNQEWQEWARQWQQAVGKGPLLFPAAHTDYNPETDRHIKTVRRPTHAVESALAAVPVLQALLPTASGPQQYAPLLRAAFTAIARHHSPFTSTPASYRLIPDQQQEVTNVLRLLPEAVRQRCHADAVCDTINHQTDVSPELLDELYINRRNPRDFCCYALLVRALRTADQQGTREGSR